MTFKLYIGDMPSSQWEVDTTFIISKFPCGTHLEFSKPPWIPHTMNF